MRFLLCWQCRLPHTRLSAPFRALALDLQLRVDAISTLSAEGKDPQTDSTGWETDECLTVSISRAGTWTGIAFWFQVSDGSRPDVQVSDMAARQLSACFFAIWALPPPPCLAFI